jgi:hypothetical protein
LIKGEIDDFSQFAWGKGGKRKR